jgi:hypothetical protein
MVTNKPSVTAIVASNGDRQPAREFSCERYAAPAWCAHACPSIIVGNVTNARPDPGERNSSLQYHPGGQD